MGVDGSPESLSSSSNSATNPQEDLPQPTLTSISSFIQQGVQPVFKQKPFFQTKLFSVKKRKMAGKRQKHHPSKKHQQLKSNNGRHNAHDLDITKSLQEFSLIPRKLPRQFENPELQDGRSHDQRKKLWSHVSGSGWAGARPQQGSHWAEGNPKRKQRK